MAREVREFAVLVPHGTPQTAPLVTSIAFPERVVTGIGWRVPPGPAGLMGWALTSAGAPVIPVQPGAYIVTDNQSAQWDLEGYLDSGNWQVSAYNAGVYDHTVYLTFLLDFPAAAPSPPPPPPGNGAGLLGTGGTVPGGTAALSSPSSPLPPPGGTETAGTAAGTAAPAQLQPTGAG